MSQPFVEDLETLAHVAVLSHRDVEVCHDESGRSYLILATPGAKQRYWPKGTYVALQTYLETEEYQGLREKAVAEYEVYVRSIETDERNVEALMAHLRFL